MGVDRVKQGVCAGVWCPLTTGVDQASRKYDGGKASVFGVFGDASGNVCDFGVDVGLGKCQSGGLTKQFAR